MTMRGFREVGWVAAVAGTALGCYMVNLKVASERASLENVENRIVLAQRDIRVLQTEIGTRGRLEQLERWNVKVLALSAPQAQQFLEGGYQLATLAKPRETIDPAAPVVLAAAPRQAGSEAAKPAGTSARDMMHVARLDRVIDPEEAEREVEKPKQPRGTRPASGSTEPKAGAQKAVVAKPAPARPAVASAGPSTPSKVAAKPSLERPRAKIAPVTKDSQTKR